jgi:hypothetical protein
MGAAWPPIAWSRCPRVLRRRIEGIPRDEQDFVPIDEHARVEGLSHVYAAGDVTNFPVKHGGLAAQQADAAADAMLAELGLPIAPRPFDPVIQGVLFTDAAPPTCRRGWRTAPPRRRTRAPSRCGGRRARSRAVTSRPIWPSAPVRRAPLRSFPAPMPSACRSTLATPFTPYAACSMAMATRGLIVGRRDDEHRTAGVPADACRDASEHGGRP